MATNIVLKKSSVVGKVPQSGDLVYGELAINYADGKLYFKDTSNVVKYFNSQTPTLQNITGAGASTTDTISVGGLEIGTYSFPTTAGSTDQVLALNASGDLEWTSVAALAGGIALTDLSVSSNVASGNGSLSYDNTTGVFTFTPADLSTKQDTLVSGTNIKTINGSSILGSGDIVVSGSGVTEQSITTTTTSAELLDSFATIDYRSAEYFITTESDSGFSAFKLIVVHDGTNPYYSTHSIVGNTNSGDVSVTIASNAVNVYFTATDASTQVKFIRTTLS